MFDPRDLRPGDRAYTYVWTGGETTDIVDFTVIRVNRVTVTVDSDDGSRRRIPLADVVGRANWKEQQ